MRNAVATLFLIALAYLTYSQHAALLEQRRVNLELTAKINAVPKAANLDLQEKCAKQAREEFESEGWEREPNSPASFVDYYNPTLNKCFMEVGNTSFSKNGMIFDYEVLLDAFEGKSYAEFHQTTSKAGTTFKQYVNLCHATLPNGEEKACASKDEFEALVKQFMK